MNLFIVDTGELGWSLYLSAHVNWLLEHKHNVIVMTSEDRFCLYNTKTIPLPYDFYHKFASYAQDGFGLHGISSSTLIEYFTKYIPEGYAWPHGFSFSNNYEFFKDRTSYRSIKPTPNVLVFPRFRLSTHHAFRNLPRSFYVLLLNRLCEALPTVKIITMGKANGAYDIKEIEISYTNYINKISNFNTIQDMINLLSNSIASIGGTSAPPKIAMLQGVPTYVIGHERERFTKTDNWMNTKVKFWDIDISEYNKFNDTECIDDICKFVKECHVN